MLSGSTKTACIVALLALISGCGRQLDTDNLEAVLQDGWRYYATGDYDAALYYFDAVYNAPRAGQDDRYSCLLGLATTCHLRNDPDLAKAQALYAELADMPLEAAQRQGMLGQGSVLLKTGETERGRAFLRELVSQHPASLEAQEATIHLADSYLKPRAAKVPGAFIPAPEEQTKQGLQILESYLREHPDCLLASQMHMNLGRCYSDRQQWQAAVRHLQAALEKGLNSMRVRAAVAWSVARIAEKQMQDYALAAKYYQSFIAETDRHVLNYRAKLSLKRVQRLMQESNSE